MKSNETQRNTIVTKTACLCALLALGDILRNINPYIQVPSLAPIIKGYPRGYPLIIYTNKQRLTGLEGERSKNSHVDCFLRES